MTNAKPETRKNLGLLEEACFGGGKRRPRLLVPLDCSPFSDAVLDTAACMARMLNADVHLLAVVVPEHDRATVQPIATWYPSSNSEDWTALGGPAAIMVETRDQAQQAVRAEAELYLRDAAHRFTGLHVRTQVLLQKSVGSAVVNYARDCKIDLIAMATHGRRPFAQAILGSVASEVVHSGVAPCMLIKPKDA
jgi:nucleotide-binding universal stress UspA family protein